MSSTCPTIDAAATVADTTAALRRSPRTRRVLLVSYTFPPVGGAGVQRVAKFAKYLSRFGWQPSVLTVANPSVPLHDASLLEDIPAETSVRKAVTWEPSYTLKTALAAGAETADRRQGIVGRFAKNLARRLVNVVLQPDVQVLWLPGAVRAGLRWLREESHDVIVASGPPFSTFLIGAALSRQTGVPLVLDYRDEWSISNAYLENRRPGALAGRIQASLQDRVVRTAQALIATTKASAAALEKVCRSAGGNAAVTWIYNGFDPDDFSAAPVSAERNRGTFRLAYVGTLWNLTTAAPLVEAVKRLAGQRPDLAVRLELFFAGRRTPAQQALLDELRDLPCQLVQHPYTDHRHAVDWLRTADALCLLLADMPGAARVVPAKLFEYFAARQPILAVAPRGEVWELLRDYPAGHAFAPDDVMGIARWLEKRLDGSAAPAGTRWNGWEKDRYSRPRQAQQLAYLLERVCENRSGPVRGARN